MQRHIVTRVILFTSTMLAGGGSFAQTTPLVDSQSGQHLLGAQPGQVAGSGQSPQPVMGKASVVAATPLDQQTGAPRKAGKVSVTGPEEVVVTAQRRSTKLSRTPVAVAVLGSAALAKANIQSEQDLQLAVPGLTVRAGQSSQQLNFALRGQSLDAYSFGRPGVLPYFDEVQISNPTGSSSTFYDLQSIQVLKGPQGTLFGRNATGGAVLYTTTKPSYDYDGYASVLGGNYGTYKAEGAVNLPLMTDKAALRVAGFYSHTDGYQTNIIDGSQRGNSDRYGVRASLRVDQEDFHNSLVVDYEYGHGTSLDGVLGNVDTTQPYAFPTAALYNPVTSDAVLGLVLQGLGVPAGAATAIATGNYGRYLASHPDANPAGLGADFLAAKLRGPFSVESDVSDDFLSRNLKLSDISTYDLGHDMQIKNVVGYINSRNRQSPNVDGTGYGITQSVGNGVVSNTSAISEELQLLGTLGPLKYVTGLYYSHENTNDQQDSLLFDIIPFGALTGVPGLYGIHQQNNFTLTDSTYAAYAQGTYDLSNMIYSGFSLTAGVRYTDEVIGGINEPSDFAYPLATTGLISAAGKLLSPPSAFSNNQSHNFGNTSWTLGLNEQFNPNLLVYLASRRSYKDGGFNGLLQPRIGYADSSVIPGDAYKTETVTDIELGTKFNGRLGSMPTVANVAGYYDWITNSQRTAFASANGSPSAITVNVPEARVYGFELDDAIDLTRWLRLGGVFNYTYAQFTNNLVTIGSLTQPFGTYPDTPRFSGGAYADLTFRINDNMDLLLHGDFDAQSKSYFSSTANINPGAVLPGYVVEDFRVGLQNHTQGWSLTANVKNAFDRTYYVGGLPLAQLTQINTILPGAPRTFTIEARLTF